MRWALIGLAGLLVQCGSAPPASGGLHQLAAVQVGSNAGLPAFGFGSAWVPNSSDGTISRVDLATNRVTALVRVGEYAAFHAAGCDKYGSVHSYMVTAWSLRQCDQPTGVATGSGLVWATRNQDRSIVAIDPRTDRIRTSIPLPITPFELASDGRQLWVTSLDDTGVAVIDERSAALVTILRNLPMGTTGVTVFDSSVWIVGSYANTVTRIDPTTTQVTGTASLPCVTVCFSQLKPLAITAGLGFIWVRNEGNATLARVDPRTLAVSTFGVESFWGRDGLDSIAAYAGAVWVGGLGLEAVRPDGRVTRRYDRTAAVVSAGAGSLWFTGSDGRLVRLQ